MEMQQFAEIFVHGTDAAICAITRTNNILWDISNILPISIIFLSMSLMPDLFPSRTECVDFTETPILKQRYSSCGWIPSSQLQTRHLL
jgi:hypothetical protein